MFVWKMKHQKHGPKKKHVCRQTHVLFSGFEKIGDFATYITQRNNRVHRFDYQRTEIQNIPSLVTRTFSFKQIQFLITFTPILLDEATLNMS